MAITGKKRSKGSSGPRRPAGAPRPVATATRTKKPWYRTRDGLMVLGIFVVVAIGVAIWLIGEAREEADALNERRAAVEAFTEAIDPIIDQAKEPAVEMTALAETPTDEALEDIQEDAARWQTALQQGQVGLASAPSSAQVAPTGQLFNEGFALYGAAAATFRQLATTDDDEIRNQLFAMASTQRDLASALFASAISSFDVLREEMGLPASDLSPPVGPGDVPQPQPPAPMEEGDEDGG